MTEYPVAAADCVACTWACSNAGTDHDREKIYDLAVTHYRTCEATDCVLVKQRTWNDQVGEVVEEVVGQVNADGLRADVSEGVSA